MATFRVRIEGEDLGSAQARLNDAGIPTVAFGGPLAGSREGKRRFRRFWRSPAFAILLVILVAFVAQRLVDPGNDERAPSYDEFLVQVDRAPRSIAAITVDPDDTSLEVVQRNRTEYEIGYPPSAEETLVQTFTRQRIETVIEDTGGASVVSLIAYLLPYVLFFAFWVFLMNRMQGREGGPRTFGQAEPASIDAFVRADTLEEADRTMRALLPSETGYRVGDPTRWD